jgi:hypothetical protein
MTGGWFIPSFILPGCMRPETTKRRRNPPSSRLSNENEKMGKAENIAQIKPL